MAVKLGEMLIKAGILTPQKLQEALEYQKTNGGKLGLNLVKMGYVKEEDLTRILSQQYGVPSIHLSKVEVDDAVVKLIPSEVAQKYLIMPVSRTGSTLIIAMVDPTNVFAMDDIKFMTGYNVEPVVASEVSIKDSIDRYYGSIHALELKKVMDEMAHEEEQGLEVLEEEQEVDLAKLEAATEEAPVVRLVNLILTDSIKRGASDIHIEPYEKDFRVRFRIDGVLYEIMQPPMKLRDAMTSRLKIMAKLDISEKRLPQDGRIKMRVSGREVDVRVSIIPMAHGEGIVMRLLDKGRMVFNLANVGMGTDHYRLFKQVIDKPHGIVLVTGPTGSGKSTTLYSALNEIKNDTLKIITVEDPVEYQQPGISQIQVHHKIGLTFAACLRSILRHDPDVVLIGEMRDLETAESAIQASLTGHIVFSTLHTNDAPSSITRMRDMGLEPFLITATVEGVLAQRLVRKICEDCRTEFTPGEDQLMELNLKTEDIKGKTIHFGRGCDRCNNTGHRGRMGIYELVVMDDELRDLISGNTSTDQLRSACRKSGMTTLRESGLRAMFNGLTTLEEIVRETVMEDEG
jgi:type IV pilus assembly protein PilB